MLRSEVRFLPRPPADFFAEKIGNLNPKVAALYIHADNWHYIGSCDITDKRFKQHKKGNVRSTKSKRPLIIIHTETFNSVSEARKREYFLKSTKGFLEKKRIIDNYYKNNPPG